MKSLGWWCRALKRLFCFLFLTATLVYLFISGLKDLQQPLPHSISFDPSMGEWWVEFFTLLDASRPSVGPLFSPKISHPPLEAWHSDISPVRTNLLKLPESITTGLRDAHSMFVSSLDALATNLPFELGTTGIVTVTEAADFGQVITLLLLIRQSGSTLPVQIFLTSSSPWVTKLCSPALQQLDATCAFLSDAWSVNNNPSLSLQASESRALSILASTFQNILFLDASSLPVQNPDSIFAPHSEPFTSTGFITWADIWAATESPDFFTVAGDIKPPSLTSRASSAKGLLVVDKARHADTLLLAAYYNYYGPDYYYPLLTQHHQGDPSRETFLASALVLDALGRRGEYTSRCEWARAAKHREKKGYWVINTPPRTQVRSTETERGELSITAQVDPTEDYRVVLTSLEEDAYHRKHLDTERADTEDAWLLLAGKEQRPVYGDCRDHTTDSGFLDVLGNLTLVPRKGKYMFFQQHGAKLSFAHFKDDMVARDAEGLYTRIWGEPDWVVATAGRDVEKLLWQDAMRFWCRQGGHRKQCRLMKKVYEIAYVRVYS